MNLKDNLKKIRKENNLSQEELAEKLGISRQSVSKWEQGITYPEMDKMIEICKLFNLNIDDLINGDIKESNKSKQVKNSINKYIDSFLKYVTKTIDMFGSMKFKNKFSCIMEQWLIIFFLFIIFKIIGYVAENIFSNILSFLPNNIYSVLFKFSEGIYTIIAIILSLTLILHIFKIRYLDYYEKISKDELVVQEIKKSEQETEEPKSKVDLKDKKERLVIRDPKHSEYRFISGLLKLILFIFKLFAFFIFIGMCITLIVFSMCFIISFIIIKTGTLFIGLSLIIISCISINYIFLRIFYAFIYNDKINKKILAIVFFTSLILIGFGIGLMSISIPDYSVVNYNDETYYLKEKEEIDMNKDMFFIKNVNYIKSDNSNLIIEYIYLKNNEVVKEQVGNGYTFYLMENGSNFPSMMKEFIRALEDKKILLSGDYSLYINIYTNESNINILKDNLNKYIEEENKRRWDYERNEYENRINELENEISNLQDNCVTE